jgi:4-amino-4-deoxychorismate lyase
LHKFVSYNGKIIKVGEAFLPALSSAAFYGQGVFTTLAIYHQKPFLWLKHWERLQNHSAKINLNLSEIPKVEESLLKLISANEIENGRARITLFDTGGSAIWSFADEQKTAVLITTAERRKTKGALNLVLSPFRAHSTSPLAGIKSCNYLENLLAFENAKAQGIDEAVRLNERDEIVSGCLANLFWVKNGRIFTPALKTGALAGTTRNLVFDLAKTLNVEIVEAISVLDTLETADEVFLTSAGIEICSVKKCNGKTYQNALTLELQKAFSEFINQ